MSVNTHTEDGQLTPFWKSVPNILSIIRLILVPVFIGFFIWGEHSVGNKIAIIALVTFCVASYTDLLDGQLARKWGVVSNFGKLVDPIADKALMGSAFILLSVYQELFWWFTVIVILREVAVTVLRMRLVKAGRVLPASQGGKIKTLLQVLLVFLWMLDYIMFNTSYINVAVGLYYVCMVVMALAFAATVLSGLVYFLDAKQGKAGEKIMPADEVSSVLTDADKEAATSEFDAIYKPAQTNTNQ